MSKREKSLNRDKGTQLQHILILFSVCHSFVNAQEQEEVKEGEKIFAFIGFIFFQRRRDKLCKHT